MKDGTPDRIYDQLLRQARQGIQSLYLVDIDAFTGGGIRFHNDACTQGRERNMDHLDVQQPFDSVSVEGFDQIYQPGAAEAQTAPDVVQGDPAVKAQPAPDQLIQHDPSLGVPLEEAAKILGLHMDTVRKRLQKGKIRGFKVTDKFGDKWLVLKDELHKVGSIRVQPIPQAQASPDVAQGDPIVEIEIAPEQAQPTPPPQVQPDPEHARLMMIIESQAHQLKAAGDVIMYLHNEIDETKTQLKLLTDSQHKRGSWHSFWSWFTGR